MEELLARGRQAAGPAPAMAFLSAAEAERIIAGLREFAVEEVGCPRWLQQHNSLDKLNMQAHHNAQTHSDEFVLELFVSLGKLDTLVQNVLAIEAWKERVFPLLAEHLAGSVDPVVSYMVLYNEAVLVNLLEVLLFHEHAGQALEEPYLLELCDWCYRKLQVLNSLALNPPEPAGQDPAAILNATPAMELQQKKAEIDFNVALAALTITRYLTDQCPRLSLGLLHRLVRTNDMVMALAPLLENPPWLRRRKGQVERFSNGTWQVVKAEQHLLLGSHDAQVWLALNNLLVDPQCRQKYALDSYRMAAVLKLRRLMNEILFDQLPVLKDLLRILDEVQMGMHCAEANVGAPILEQMPGIQQQLVSGKDWKAIAQQQCKTQFGASARTAAQSTLSEMLNNLDFLCEMQSGPGEPSTATDNDVLKVKASFWRKVTSKSGGIHEAWSDVQLSSDPIKPPEQVTISTTNGECVTGLRHRLVVDGLGSKPLPTDGKVVVVHAGTLVEAVFQLPTLPLRKSPDAPQVLWVTVGLLAVDGFVLQLKLCKATEDAQRDQLSGTWFAYQVAGGALTVKT